MSKANKVEEQQEQADTEEQQNQSQIYDTSMKELVDKQVKDILPVLLPGATYEGTLNVEIVRPVMRTDKVYIVNYCGRKHILHIEFESSRNPRMGARMSAYNAILHLEYDLPVISILIYLFETKMVVTPFLSEGADGIITKFHFRIIPLFRLKAAQCVREHSVCLYPLLSLMKGANRRLLKAAVEELVEVYRSDKETLGDFIAYMVVLLERVKTIAPLEKEKMKEVLNMYNNLWDQSPIIRKMKAASRAEGEAEGEAKGEIKGLQNGIVDVVTAHFPLLADLARQRVAQMNDTKNLRGLLVQISTAPDEARARLLLAPTEA